MQSVLRRTLSWPVHSLLQKSAFGSCEGLSDRSVGDQGYMQLEKLFRQEIDLGAQMKKSSSSGLSLRTQLKR